MANGTIIGPTSVLDVATAVLAAASTALASSTSGAPGRVVLAPGTDVAWDSCECGLLALTTGRFFKSRGQIFTDAGDTYLNCDAEVRVMSYSILIARCTPVVGPENDTAPPSVDQLATAFVVQEEDAYLVWQAVADTLCGLMRPPTPQIAAYVINERVPTGPLGGCSGTQLNFKVGWYRPCNCDDVM